MKKNGLALLALSFVLGMLIIIQFKTVEKSTGGIVSSQKAHQLALELKSLRDRKEIISKELKDLDNRIEEYKNTKSEGSIVKNLKKDIKKYELLAGYTDVKGPGVVVNLKEHSTGEQDSAILLYNYDYILSIINILKASGAEAISINNERIVSNTDMKLVVNNNITKLMINGNPYIPPFQIKCIGNSSTLDAALNLRYGIVWELRNNYKIDVEVVKKDEINVPRFIKKINYKYSKPLE